MLQDLKPDDRSRKRVLLIVHCFDADFSMESRLSWFRAVQSAEVYDTTVVCVSANEDCLSRLPAAVRENLHVVTVPHTGLEKSLLESPVCFYFAYRMWHRRVCKLLKQKHAQVPFDLVHQVSYCGFREPGEGWRLGAAFFWGPIGGTQNVPWRFLRELSLLGATKEVCRAVVNHLQMHYSLRVGNALRSATKVFAANSEAQERLHQARGVKTDLQLETGLDTIRAKERPQRDPAEPLKILWAGRLESWKGLPLLLKALAKTPVGFSYQLRILGSGTYAKRWRRLASRLGLEQVEWIDLPGYKHRQEHYDWADVFVFTSLRDTSGTGVLEALASGVPLVGLNHQGARDIMTADCALRIPVKTPQQTIKSIGDGLCYLADNPEELQRLSAGAVSRAQAYHWDRLGEAMIQQYRAALGERVSVADPEDCCETSFFANKSPSTVMS